MLHTTAVVRHSIHKSLSSKPDTLPSGRFVVSLCRGQYAMLSFLLRPCVLLAIDRRGYLHRQSKDWKDSNAEARPATWHLAPPPQACQQQQVGARRQAIRIVYIMPVLAGLYSGRNWHRILMRGLMCTGMASSTRPLGQNSCDWARSRLAASQRPPSPYVPRHRCNL